MATATRHDAGRAHVLQLVLDGTVVPGVVALSGLGVDREVIEYREGNDRTGGTRRLPGRLQGGDAVVTRALTTDPTFEAWVRGPGPDGAAVARREVRVHFFDRHGSPVRRYRLVGAWPRRLELAGSTEPGAGGLLEHLTISYDACVPE